MAPINWKNQASGDWTDPTSWDIGTVPTSADDVTLGLTGYYYVTADAPIAAQNVSITNDSATLDIEDSGGTSLFGGDLDVEGELELDSNNASGGSTLNVAGTLSVNGSVQLGESGNNASANTLLQVGALAGAGDLYLYGATTGSAEAQLVVLAAAPTTLDQSVQITGSGLLQFASGSIQTITNSSGVYLDGTTAFIATQADQSHNGALSGLSEIDGSLTLSDGAVVAVSGDLLNTGDLNLEDSNNSPTTPSSLTVAGTLTNTGDIDIRAFTGTAPGATLLQVGNLAGTGNGTITIEGGASAGASQAELVDLGAAPASLSQYITVTGNGLLEFASGSLGTLAGGFLRIDGTAARVATQADLSTNSALTGLSDIEATLELDDGATAAIGGDLLVNGAIVLDDSGSSAGGSLLTVAGTLTDDGSVTIGASGGGITSPSTLQVNDLAGTGQVTLYGSSTAAAQAQLVVLAAAPTTLTNSVQLSGDSLLQYQSGTIDTIASNATVRIDGNAAFIGSQADNSNPDGALVDLSEVDGSLVLTNGASKSVYGNLLVTNFLGLDSDNYSTEGGSDFGVTQTLTDNGTVVVGPGNGDLSAGSDLSATGLAGTGAIYLQGSTAGAGSPVAELDITDAASTLTNRVYLSGMSLLRYSSGSIQTIANGALLSLSGANAQVVTLANYGNNSALAGLTEIDGTLAVTSGASVAVTGDVTEKGSIDLDGNSYTSEGGSSLSIAGTLTNSGSITVGVATGGLSANTLLSVGQLAGSAPLSIYGGTSATPPLAEVEVASAAPGTLDSSTYLSGNALLSYGSGSINTIAASVTLTINGTLAYVADAAAATSNSALTGLTEIDGSLAVTYGANVAITGNVTDTGTLNLDGDGYTSEGGSTLTIGGTLTDSNQVYVGVTTGGLSANTLLSVGQLAGTGQLHIHGGTSATPPLAGVQVASAAPGTLTSSIDLNGNALLSYGSGSINTIAQNVTLTIAGMLAYVADTAAATSNSALTGLTEIDGTLAVTYGASVTTTGNLLDTGLLDLDGDGYTSEGGSTLTVAGTLTDNNQVYVGVTTGGLSANTLLSVGQLAGTGQLHIYGSTSTTTPPPQAEIQVASAAPGTLAISTYLNGNALLSYASGSINTIAQDVTLGITGTTAYVADAAAAASNSALTGLTEIDGTLAVTYGASVTTTGNLLDTGLLDLDGDGYTSEGGSTLTVAGTLTDNNQVYVGVTTGGLSANTLLSVGQLAGTGQLHIYGSTSTTTPPPQAEIQVASAAPGTLTYSSYLNGNALLDYASGSINTIGQNVTLALTGTTAHVANAADTSSNSALTGLTGITGTLSLTYGASVTTGGNLGVTGGIDLDGDGYSSEGGSNLAIGGALNNAGQITVGVYTGGATAATTLTAGSLSNSGTINLYGSTSYQAILQVHGSVTNTGTLNVGTNTVLSLTAGGVFTQSAGTTSINGTLDAGAIDISGGTLFLSGITSTPVAFLGSAGTLEIGVAPAATPTVAEFQMGDTIDFQSATGSTTSASYNSGDNITTVTVTLVDGSTRSVDLIGDFANNTLALANANGDTQLSTVAANQAPNVPPTLTVPGSTLGQEGSATSVSGISVADADATSAQKNFTVTISDGTGTLSASTNAGGGGGGITGAGTTQLTIAGTLAQVDADLTTLTVNEPSLSPDTITASVIDGRGGSAGPDQLAVSVNAPALITAPTTAAASLSGAVAITGVSIADADASSASETVTVTLSDTSGDLAATASGAAVTGSGTTHLSIAGTLAQVNAALGTLTDTATQAGGDTINITSDDGRGGGRTAAIATTTNAAMPPVITARLQVVGNNIESPIDGISVQLAAGTPAGTAISVTLSEASGGLALQNSSGASVSGATTALTVSGTVAEVNAALASLVYTGGATSIGISATADGNTATDTIPVSLPSTNNPDMPYDVPVSITLQNGNSVVAAGGQTSNPGTAALLQWDQGGTAYVGTVYVNLPLTSGALSEIGFAASDSDTSSAALSAAGEQEPFATVTGDWDVSLGSVGGLVTDGDPVSIGTVTDSSAGQTDEITLTFTSQADQDLPDRRVTVIFNQPGGTTVNGPDGDADGDVHLTTYGNLYYNFQAVGEFVLTRSTVANDPFQVQIRLQPWNNSAVVSIITEVGVQVGADRVTFDLFRANTVWVDGAAANLSSGAPLALTAGTIVQTTASSWTVQLKTGETVTVSNAGSFLNVQTTLASGAAAGSVQGLLGTDTPATAGLLTLPDGTTLSATPSATDLYTTYANAWRITQASSLLDYGAGQTTATFTDTNFPADADPLASIPASVLQNAEQLVAASGITDPAVANAAILDYALTGDTSFIAADAALQPATQAVAVPDPANATPVDTLGIAATAPSVTQATAGTIANYVIYRTGDTSAAEVVNYSVGTGVQGDLGASYFPGGVLPSGQVTIAAGQTEATLSLSVTNGLGPAPSGQVEVDITPATAGPVLSAPTAFVTVDNNQAVPGTPAQPEILDPSGVGIFSQSGNAYTIALGTLAAGATLTPFVIDIANEAATGANTLFGDITASGSGASFGNGLRPIAGLLPGAQYQITVTPDNGATGTIDETITFDANQLNNSGYSAVIGPVTLHITGAVEASAVPVINTASPVAIGNVHLGATALSAISITNAATAPATDLDASIGTASAGVAGTGTLSELVPNATNTTSIQVGLDTTTAGAKSGTVGILFNADTGSGNAGTLTPGSVSVTGAVYRYATASLAPIAMTVHVGDAGTAALSLSNTAPADGYSETLDATLTGTSGAITATTGATAAVLAGQTSNAFTVGFSTAQAGVDTGTATIGVGSDGSSIDGLGQTAEAAVTAPVTVTVDNYAKAAFQNLSGIGTLTVNGNNATINLGTLALGTGPATIALGVTNAASGPADLLSGSLSATGSGALTAAGLAAFAGLAAGQSDTAPSVTLDTSTAGQFSETITLQATGSNVSGYSGALPTQTLTIEGNVASLPAPTITAPGSQTVFDGITTVLGPLSIADANAGAAAMTVVVSDATGVLNATTAGAGKVTGSGSNRLVLTGSLTDVNAELASLAYTTANSGTDTVSVTATDGQLATSTTSETITSQAVPITAPVVMVPGLLVGVPGQANGLSGLEIIDPYAQATGQQVTLTVSSGGPYEQTYNASGSGGAVVTGQGTSSLSITGTVDQVNAYLSDGITDNILADAYAKAQADAEKAGEEYELANFSLGAFTSLATEGLAGLLSAGVDELESKAESAAGIPQPPDLGQELVQVDVGNFSFAANVLNDIAAIAGGATQLPPPAGGGGGEPHLITFSGLTYSMEAAGDFLLAGSTASSNSFLVEARFEPLNNSAIATGITQIAAEVGTDRVTIDASRASTVYLDGSPLAVTIGTPVTLNGGELTELSAGSYRITWNTGESVTVTLEGGFLDVNVGLGANDTAGTISGLLGPNNGQANDFTLPDGTVLAQPLTSTTLAEFVNEYRLPEALSLLDYAPGQSDATISNPNFPATPLSLSDFPADVVAAAAAAVAAYGITDPATVAAAEYDYIVSGGNTAAITADQSLFQGVTATTAPVTQTGATPVLLGIFAPETEVPESASGATTVTFEVYLTAAAAQDTVVAYAVSAADANDLNAAAFGGTLPSGQVTIAAGQTSARFTIAVPQGALGTAASGTVDVAISTAAGLGLVNQDATAAVVTPAPGAPPVPELSELTPFGTFIEDSPTSYTLDLGAVQYGETLPALQFAIMNAATGNADQLGGTIAVDTVEGFTASGTTIPGAIASGQSYTGLTTSINTIKFGQNVETITYTPTDTNASGYSATLAPITLTILDTLELPTLTYSEAWGDVHVVTFNNTTYNFQAVGEFWLDQSRIAGDTFGIQLRLQPLGSSAVTVITQTAISLGTDRVTFDLTRPDFVEVDGAATTLSLTNPTLALAGGTITEVSSSVFRVAWSTGEVATITNAGPWENVVDGVPAGDLGGGIAGLQGEGEGTQNDFQLPDGTVLPQPLTTDTLYNVFGNAWRVSQADSLFDYGPGQTTATFTDTSFPSDIVSLSSLPSNLVAQAAQMAAAAGITDPTLAADAELDYLASGSMAAFNSSANVQQAGLVRGAEDVTEQPTAATSAGVAAAVASVAASSSATTQVVFDAYLTQAVSTDTQISYQVVSSGSGDLGAAAFGGTLPSGTVTIAANATMAQFTVAVPVGALGSLPSANVQVQIAAPSGDAVFASTAQTTLTNPTPETGSPAVAQLAYLGNVGRFTQSGNTYTLTLSSVQDQSVPALQFAIINAATGTSDSLGGTFSSPTGTGFTVSGATLSSLLGAGQSYNGLYFTTQTTSLGSDSETIVFHPVDTNGSGYSQALPDLTLVVTDPVLSQAQGRLNTPATILFPNVRVGTADTQAVSITNSATAPAAALDVAPLTQGSATASGSITALAPGATDATDVSVGVSTAAAGAQSGTVTLLLHSDAGGVTTPLASSPVDMLFGNVYRPAAAATITPISEIVHVGDTVAPDLLLTNTDPADGYSENLLASLAAVPTGASITGSGTTPEIAASASDSSLGLSVSTAAAAVITGNATVALTSDGGTGASSIDGLGQLALGTVQVPVSVTVDNYAVAATSVAVGGTATPLEGGTLSLGTLQLGSGPVTIALTEANSASGPADLLAASLTSAGANGFTNALTDVSGLGAGQSASAGDVSLSTDEAGTFSETITVNGVGSNASGYSGALAAQTITIEGTVAAAGTTPAGVVQVTPASLTVAENAAATAIGIIPPTDTAYTPAQLTITVTGLPSDGTVTLADGTVVQASQGLTATQLAGLQFTPTAGQFGKSSTFTYTATDPSGASAAGSAALAIGPAIGAPVTVPGSLTVAPGQSAPLTIQAPTDPNYASSALTATVTALPTDGTIDLGATAITLNQVLSTSQLTSLTFLAASNLSNVSSSFGYTVSDPAGNSSSGSFTVGISPAAPLLPPAPVITTPEELADTPTPTIMGTAVAGSTVTLFADGTASGTAVANPAGTFAAALANPLALGNHTITATATTSAGQSAASTGVNVFDIEAPGSDGIIHSDYNSLQIGTLESQGYALGFTPTTESLQTVDGTLSLDVDTEEALLQRDYLGLLGRRADLSGLSHWDDQLYSGNSQGVIATDFLNSAEYLSTHATMTDTQFVASLYQGFLGRAPDAGGAAFYTGLLASGTSRGDVVASIADSQEAKTYLAPQTPAIWVPSPESTLVYEAYQTGLNQEVPLPALNTALSQLRAGTTPQQFVQALVGSSAFVALHGAQDNATFIASLYQAGLGRAPDAGGQAFYANILNSGSGTRADVLADFINAPETTSHLTRTLTA